MVRIGRKKELIRFDILIFYPDHPIILLIFSGIEQDWN